MKSKGGSLYEVLKSASRPSGADEGAPTSPEPPGSAPTEGSQTTLQERLAAYKAAKLAAVTQTPPPPAIEAATAKPASATLILEPDPTPIPPMVTPTVLRPLPPPASAAPVEETPLPPAKGPGERVVRLTYNTALFGGMVAVGLLFVAYAVGLHVGKSQAPVDAPAVERPVAKAPAPVVPAPTPLPTPVPAPAPRKEFTIRLGEWKFVTSQDKVKALALADDPELKKQLERAGHRGFSKEFIKSGNDVKMALYVNRYTDLNSEAAKSALTAMKTFRFRGQTPFAGAAFEEAPAR
jgi:hypothetical protein